VLGQLREQLSGFDAAASDTVEENREALRVLLRDDTLAKLEQAVGRFDFDAALALLPGVASESGG